MAQFSSGLFARRECSGQLVNRYCGLLWLTRFMLNRPRRRLGFTSQSRKECRKKLNRIFDLTSYFL